jgi:hypothetical protein
MTFFYLLQLHQQETLPTCNIISSQNSAFVTMQQLSIENGCLTYNEWLSFLQSQVLI